MPWKETVAVKERVKFLLEWERRWNDAEGRMNFELLRCEGTLEPDGREVQRIFDSAFQEYGLPATIRSDDGPPFATVGDGGLSKHTLAGPNARPTRVSGMSSD